MAEAQCLNWASLLPGRCQRGFDWGDGWIQAKLGCKKSLSTGWWWLHFGGASTKVSPIMFFLWETHLTKVSFQSWITCNFILIYYKFTSLTHSSIWTGRSNLSVEVYPSRWVSCCHQTSMCFSKGIAYASQRNSCNSS